jgi:SHS2 domain-containing protein
MMVDVPFEEVEHTADAALRVRGKDFAQLLRNAAFGMLKLAQIFPGEGTGKRESIRIKASDREDLLVRWLEELLFRLESCGVVYRDIELKLGKENSLVATLTEVPVAGMGKQIKAVTYHNLHIDERAEGLEVTVVFDI